MKVTTLLSLTITLIALSGVGDIAQIAVGEVLGTTPHQSNPDCKFSPCD